MVGIFKQKAPGNVALLFFFGLLIKLPLFLHPRHPMLSSADGKLYTSMAGFLQLQAPVLTSVLALLLVYIQAMILTVTINEYRMTAKPSFLPGMAYLLINSLVPEWTFLSAPLVAGTLLLWAFNRLFALYNAEGAGGRVYNIGLITGIASFIYFPAAALILCLIIGLVILRPFRITDVLILLMGFLTPYYFYAAWLYLFATFRLNLVFPTVLSFYVPRLPNSIWLVFSTIFLGFPFLSGGYYVQAHLRKMLIQARKNWSILLLFLLLALVLPFVNSTDLLTPWLLTAAPFAAFHACTYLYGKKWSVTVLFFAMSAFILIQQFVSGTWL